jgi:hypothetical protein
MKKFLFTFLSLLFLSGCAEELECCQNVFTHYYDVAVIDSLERDLLDPNTPGAINHNDIRLFRLETNHEVEVALKGGGVLDNPHGVMPLEEDGSRFVRLFFDSQGLEDEFIGIIQWDKNKRDTVTHQFNQAGKEKHLVQIMHNGHALWELGDSTSPFITFRK